MVDPQDERSGLRIYLGALGAEDLGETLKLLA